MLSTAISIAMATTYQLYDLHEGSGAQSDYVQTMVGDVQTASLGCLIGDLVGIIGQRR
jgi:hypothetical protein